ncbi:gamma-glutamyltransferase [Membranihabitans maritimus]|uniref:gamma-glutamyltransferase n=1 Tax=Membranihabitans maritimus TaxID=2904244 RepID=UPI001F01FC25|nr:gamma-glutamyltransferase [Membranihabitans maritimus]
MKNYTQKSIILLTVLLLFNCKTIELSKEKAGHLQPNGMVVSACPHASQIGKEILLNGGNAIDAAVAVQLALAVSYPRAGNIGGGGFAVIRMADGTKKSLDFREKASRHAHKDLYLDSRGNVIDGLSLEGHLASGVPGTVDGMVTLHEWGGNLQWQQVVQPAIDLAINGFRISELQAHTFNRFLDDFIRVNRHAVHLSEKDHWEEGDSVKFPQLALTLKRIRDHKRAGFYKGKTAQLIVQEMESGRGLIDYTDLDNYHSKWRAPLQAKYKDYNIISMPPPSSGGIALIQMLKGLESYNISRMEHNSTDYVHLLTEVEKRAYADRATFLGDPDYAPVPVDMLVSDDYLSRRMGDISLDTPTPSSEIKEGNVEIIESVETTHFSIVDSEGNAIAITTTINSYFGSKVWVDGAGFFMNNEMDDFSAKPGVPNQFGLVGNEINSIQPEKRMLSSMTPTILEKNGDLYMVVGTPGGSTIITSVLQTILNTTEFGMTMKEAVDARRFHHQWLPDVIISEDNSFSDEVKKELLERGFAIQERGNIGMVDAILIWPNQFREGAADDQRGDNSANGY